MKLISIILPLLFAGTIFGQNRAIFHRITSENGLTSDFITSIQQDNQGFLWIGTQHGLNRYDGTHIRQFIHKNDDSSSLSNNAVIGLYKDKKGKIWTTSYFGGIDIYDNQSQTFSHYKKPAIIDISGFARLLPLDNENVLVPQGNICFLDLRTSGTRELAMPVNSWSLHNKDLDSTFDCTGAIKYGDDLWLYGNLGFLIYNTQTKKFKPLCNGKSVPYKLKNSNVWDMAADKSGNIWIASGEGLFEYEQNTQAFKSVFPREPLRNSTQSLWVKCIFCDTDNSIWFGTDNGLFHYLPSSGQYMVYRNDPNDFTSISDNSINCFYKDAQGILWIGTENGLNAIYPFSSFFTTYQNKPDDANSIASNYVAGIYKDENKNIWVSSGSLINKINTESGRIDHFRYQDDRLPVLHEFSYRSILSQGNYLWLGSWSGGLQVFDLNNQKFIASYVHRQSDTGSICSNYLNDLCLDKKGNIWIASWNGGIDAFNIKSKRFRHYNAENPRSGVHKNYVHSIYMDDDGNIWAGVIGGLQEYNPKNDLFEFYTITTNTNDYSEASPLCIADAGNQHLWIGTLTGLVDFDKVNKSYKKLPVAESSVQSILVDKKTNDLWLATEVGLIQYDPISKKSKTYTLTDGLPSLIFNHYNFKSADNTFFFATHHGLVIFNPEKQEHNNQIAPVYITSFKVKDKEYPTSYNFNNKRSFELDHDQNVISIEFSALNFINAQLNNYSYKLTGVDTGWSEAGGKTEITYASLPPGSYTFMVKGSNNDDIWNKTPAELTFIINPAWYQSSWFFILCMLCALMLLYFYYRIKINQILKLQAIRNHIASDLHDEIGSTLSSIRIMSDTAQKKIELNKGDISTSLQKISQNAATVQESMNDIVWTLKPNHDKIDQVIARLRSFAAEIFEARNIALHFHADEFPANFQLSMEKRKNLYLIAKESINNVAKYSGCNECDINILNENKSIRLLIKDNGKGFSVGTDQTNGNGMVNMRKRAEEINAILYIGSAPGAGTTIDLLIKTT